MQRDHWRGRHWNLAVKSGIEDGFQALVALIEDEGYDRRWGAHLWRSIDLADGLTYSLYWEYAAARAQRTIINRWKTSELGRGRAPTRPCTTATGGRTEATGCSGA